MKYSEFKEIEPYINRLLEKYPDIKSIWLFGSQVNRGNKEPSDWDILVFGNKSILESLKIEPAFQHEKIDLLVVYDDKNFKQPWILEKKKGQKHGNLDDWKWKEINSRTAEYESAKHFPITVIEKAVKIYP